MLLVIDNYDSFTYNLAHLLDISGCQVEVVRNDEVSADQVAAFGPSGVLISPGPCTPSEAGISIAVVRACGATTPLLGICLGHQAIAAAFGAAVIRAPRPVHGKTSQILHDGGGVLRGLPPLFAATRYHSLVVDAGTLPPFLAITARTRERLPMGLRHTERPIEGVQFHPESVLTTHGEQIIRNFAEAIRRRALTVPCPAARCGSAGLVHVQRGARGIAREAVHVRVRAGLGQDRGVPGRDLTAELPSQGATPRLGARSRFRHRCGTGWSVRDGGERRIARRPVRPGCPSRVCAG
jgi:anthranilate synthase/aminodeoxychorismate synthase-like glutamine amidotransferase